MQIKSLLASLTLLFLLWPGSPANASHIVGGDITYKCLGNNKYEITLNVYRDCFFGDPAAWFDSPAFLGIYRLSNNTLYQQVSMSFSGINDTLSNFINDPCLFIPPVVCVHATQYKRTVTLPYDPAGYELVYVRCCRNATVQNIMSPDSTGATYCVTLSGPAMQLCNTAPDFGAAAPIYICVNKELVYDHSATEPDGDSLVYRLNTPFAGGAFDNAQPIPPAILPPLQTVQWIDPPYNENNMLGASVPLSIDPQTGVLTALPSIIGQFVVGIAVDEYRNGVLLSTVRRDFQYNIGECGEIISSFFAPNAQCENLTVSFDNQSTLATHYLWYFDWDNDQSLTSTEENPTFTFPDTGWYTVALIAEPASQCVDTFFKQIYLQNNSLFVDFSLTVFDCVDTTVLQLMDFSLDTVSPVISWFWEVQYGGDTLTSTLQHPNFQVPRNVTGTVTLTALSLNGCEQSISKDFETGTDEFPISLIQDSLAICLGESVQLNSLADSIGPYPYFWEPDSLFADPTLPSQIVTPNSTSVYTVTINAPDSICFAQTTITVTVIPLPELDFDYTIDCNGRTVNFINNSLGEEGYLWNFGDPSTNADTSLLDNPIYSYQDTGTYLVTLTTGAGALCADTITKPVVLEENILEADFTYTLADCETDSVVVVFTDQSQNTLNNTIAWNWVFGALGVSDLQNPTLTVFLTDTIEVTYTITTVDNCQDSITRKIFIQLPEDQFLADSTLLCPGDSVALNPGGNEALEYLWSPADGLSDPTAANPVASPSQTTTYTVTVSVPDFSVCFITREVKVEVPPQLNLTNSGDVTTCDPQVTLTANTDAPATITWVNAPGGPFTGNEITVDVTGLYTYIIVAEDAFGCSEETSLTVQGGPVDYALSADSIVICSDEAFDVFVTNLDPNDTLVYVWAPNPAILSGNDTPNPVVSGAPGQTVLYINMTNQFGCVADDSIYLAIVDADIQLDFDYEIIDCDGLIVQFNNLSQNAYGYVWSFGDPANPGASSLEENPVYTYSAIDTYLVTLNVLYNAECVEPVTKPVELLDPVLEADFRFSFTNCTEESVTIGFVDQSINFLNNTTNWDWTFSTGESSTEQNPEITVTENQTLIATLVITTAIGCVDSVTFEIPIQLTFVDLADSITLCFGDTAFLNPLGDPGYEYLWSPATGLSDPTAANPLVFTTETTTYTAQVTNFIGDTCQIVKTINVFVPPFIDIDAAGGEAIACNEPINLEVSANISPLDFTWTLANGDTIGTGPGIVVFPTNTTTYFITAADAFGCSVTDTVVVIVPTLIQVEIQGEFVSCQAPVDLIAISNAEPVSFQWFADGVPFAGDTSAVTVNPLVSTTYTVIATDTFGCQAIADSLVIAPEDIDLNVSDTQIGCQLPVGLAASASVPVSYVWTANGVFVSNEPAISVEPGATTWYVVTATDDFGCIAVDSVLVIVPPPLAVTLEGQEVSCQEEVTLEAISTVMPVTYQWFADNTPFGGNTPSVTVNPGGTTLYAVMVTDTFGCQAMDTATLIVPDEIILIVSETQISCQVPVDLLASANVPVSYEWTANGVFVSNEPAITVEPGATTWYIVTATDDFGCIAVDSVLVIVPPPLAVTLEGQEVSCQEEVTLEAISTVMPVTYQWFANNTPFGGNTPSVTINPGGTTLYAVMVTDTFGCQAIDTAIVVVPNEIILTVTEDQISCQTPVDLLASANVPVSYEWTANGVFVSNEPAITVDPGVTTLYIVTATDSLGCFETGSVLVTVPIAIDMTVTTDTTACDGPITLAASANVPLVFEWWTPDPDTILNSQITVLPDTSAWYYVLGTDDFGCEALDSVFVINGIVDIQAEGEIIICPVDSLVLEVTNTDPFDMLSYLWEAGVGGVILSDPTQAQVTVSTSPGPVEFYITAVNQFGCSATDTVTVVMSDFMPTINDTVNICAGIPTPINPGANPNYVYNWEPLVGGIDPADPNPVVVLTQSQTFTVTITDFEGVDTCSAVFVVEVLVNPDIELMAMGGDTLCEFVPLTLTATTGVSPVDLTWYDNPALTGAIGQGSEITVNPAGAIVYYVVAEDALGCLDTASVEVFAFPIDISTIPQYELCIFEDLVIGVVNNDLSQTLTYQWVPPAAIVEGGNTATPLVNPLVSTTFTVTVENQYGCVESASTFVNVIDVLTGLFATADPDSIYFGSGVTSQLETVFNSIYTYFWWPEGSLNNNLIFNPVASPDTTTTYYVEVEGLAGCRGIDSVTVFVLNPPCEPPFIFVPSGFSPNDDGQNDVLFVRGNGIDEVYFAVYSRWGQLVFETTDLNVGWDGTFNGQRLAPDVFGYYLQAKCFNGDDYFEKGNVTLVR